MQEEDEVYDGEETIDYWFYVNRWFASDEDDKQIIRELIPTDKDGKPLRKALDGRNLSNFGSEKLLLITRVSFNLQVQTFSIEELTDLIYFSIMIICRLV